MADQMSKDEQEELRKKMESMSPEELKEFQKKQCIFCHIVSGKVASKKIFEDEKALAVLDINPANPGHVLLMPKEHYMIMPQMPEEDLKRIFILAKQISNSLLKALDVRGTNIVVANGGAAGQRAQHFMIHIIPRKEGDGVNFELPSHNRPESELDSVAMAVGKKLSELTGTKPQQKTAEDILKESKKKVIEAEFKEEKFPAKKEEPTVKLEMPKPKETIPKVETPKFKEEKKGHTKDDRDEDDDEDETEIFIKKKDEKPKKDEDIDLDAIARVLNGR